MQSHVLKAKVPSGHHQLEQPYSTVVKLQIVPRKKNRHLWSSNHQKFAVVANCSTELVVYDLRNERRARRGYGWVERYGSGRSWCKDLGNRDNRVFVVRIHIEGVQYIDIEALVRVNWSLWYRAGAGAATGASTTSNAPERTGSRVNLGAFCRYNEWLPDECVVASESVMPQLWSPEKFASSSR